MRDDDRSVAKVVEVGFQGGGWRVEPVAPIVANVGADRLVARILEGAS